MINFLVVDDNVINIKILKLMIVEYMTENNIDENEYNIFKANDGQEAIYSIEKNSYDLVFLDIMMPIMNGLNALRIIRKMNLSKQPIIVMATTLGDDLTKEEEKEYGANAYVVRPFGKKTINLILDYYLRKIIDNIIEDDDFFDFDEIEDAPHAIDNQNIIMEEFNNSHINLSTEELLKEYDYLHDEIILDLEEIDCLVMSSFNLEEDTLDLDTLSNDILRLFKLFSSFLQQFSEFDELSKAISSLADLIRDLDTENMEEENKELLGIYIKAIIMDLLNWKEHVFIKQDAGDVFYANASLLSSYIEVKKLIR